MTKIHILNFSWEIFKTDLIWSFQVVIFRKLPQLMIWKVKWMVCFIYNPKWYHFVYESKNIRWHKINPSLRHPAKNTKSGGSCELWIHLWEKFWESFSLGIPWGIWYLMPCKLFKRSSVCTGYVHSWIAFCEELTALRSMYLLWLFWKHYCFHNITRCFNIPILVLHNSKHTYLPS